MVVVAGEDEAVIAGGAAVVAGETITFHSVLRLEEEDRDHRKSLVEGAIVAEGGSEVIVAEEISEVGGEARGEEVIEVGLVVEAVEVVLVALLNLMPSGKWVFLFTCHLSLGIYVLAYMRSLQLVLTLHPRAQSRLPACSR